MASTHFTEAPPPPHRACPAMPELPEVESARRVLEEHLRGKRISAVVAETDDKIMQGGLTGEEVRRLAARAQCAASTVGGMYRRVAPPLQLAKKLVGLTVENVGRKGKVLWMRLRCARCGGFASIGTGAVRLPNPGLLPDPRTQQPMHAVPALRNDWRNPHPRRQIGGLREREGRRGGVLAATIRQDAGRDGLRHVDGLQRPPTTGQDLAARLWTHAHRQAG